MTDHQQHRFLCGTFRNPLEQSPRSDRGCPGNTPDSPTVDALCRRVLGEARDGEIVILRDCESGARWQVEDVGGVIVKVLL